MSGLRKNQVYLFSAIPLIVGCFLFPSVLLAEDSAGSLRRIEKLLTELQAKQQEILDNQKKAFDEIHELKIRIRRA